MNPFALPYDPSAAPVLDLIGHGYRPAWQPADYIGPRRHCAMWLPAPDADRAWLAKYDGTIDPWGPIQLSGGQSLGGGASGVWTPAPPPLEPVWPDPWEPCCIWTEPDYPGPPTPVVPIEVGTGLMLVVALAMLATRGGGSDDVDVG